MNIPEKYRERYDELAKTHPWMREMVDGATDTLPARDPVEIMRECGGMEHGMGSLREMLGIECVSGWQMRCLSKLADMVERDYVSILDFEAHYKWLCAVREQRDELRTMNSRLQAERDELTSAINELQKKQPYCYNPEAPLNTLRTVGRYIDELTAERDEWKAKANCVHDYEEGACEGNPFIKKWTCRKCGHETLLDGKAEGSSKVRAGSSRSAKRAAAVERLRGMVLNTGSAIKKLAIALDVKWNPDNAPLSMAVLQNTLIDLLTDDDSTISEDDSTTESLSDGTDSREKLEEDALVLVDNLRMYGGKYAGDAEVEIIGMLARQEAITEREWSESNDRLIGTMRSTSKQYRAKIADLQSAYDELARIAAELCRACGFSMCDASGEVIS